MPFQYSITVRNAKLDAVESAIGPSPILKILTGSLPSFCSQADSGTVLATCNLPADWMADASGGTKSMSGVWNQQSAEGSGNAGHFRIYDSGGATCHMQGTVTGTGKGGDMTVDNVVFAAGQQFTVTSFTITAGNV